MALTAQRLRQWERFYREEKVAAASEHRLQQEELLTELERLLAISEDELVLRQQAGASSEWDAGKSKSELARKGRIRRKDAAEHDPLVARIKELEAACKQKVGGRPNDILVEDCGGAARDGVRREVEGRDSQVRPSEDYQHGSAGTVPDRLPISNRNSTADPLRCTQHLAETTHAFINGGTKQVLSAAQ
ncbi:hypothetical protein ON010_g732 [Phytophthora cinnamomi]|nr:hypothetical protein ON010_g732 [Phytophthora cinnamomi]